MGEGGFACVDVTDYGDVVVGEGGGGGHIRGGIVGRYGRVGDSLKVEVVVTRGEETEVH